MERTFAGIKIKGDHILQCLESPEGTRWVEFILDEAENGTVLGVCTDVTADMKIQVTEADNSTAEYTISLAPVLSSEKAITATTVGTLSSGNLTLVPGGTKVSVLKAALTVSDLATVEIITGTGGI